jgi:hypothetical protein
LVSIDLDPSASQKVAAFKLANRLPSLKDELGIESGDDLRRAIVEKLADESGCDIDYDDDVKPWIGSSAGVGLVGESDPHPALALAITDEDKARAGARLLLDCLAPDTRRLGEDPLPLGFAVNEKWLVIESDTAAASALLAAGKADPLAGSDDYTHWTEAAGDPGILTAYAAPGSAAPILKAAGDKVTSGLGGDLGGDLGGSLGHDLGDDLGGLGGDLGGGLLGGVLGSGFGALCPGLSDSAEEPSGSSALADFAGAGATLRFNDSGLEFEFAGGAGERSEKARVADVASLPDDVGATLAIGFADGWVDNALANLQETCGTGFDPSGLYALVSAFTGLDAPEDLQTLTQRSAQLAFGPDLDVESMLNSDSLAGLPLALRIMGDPSTLKPVVDKLGALAPGSSFFDAKASEDSVTLGFDQAWRDEVAAGGDLGRNPTFKGVVPHASEATSVLFVDAAAIKDAFGTVLGTTRFMGDLDVLSALGASLWPEDDVTHGQLIVKVK